MISNKYTITISTIILSPHSLHITHYQNMTLSQSTNVILNFKCTDAINSNQSLVICFLSKKVFDKRYSTNTHAFSCL